MKKFRRNSTRSFLFRKLQKKKLIGARSDLLQILISNRNRKTRSTGWENSAGFESEAPEAVKSCSLKLKRKKFLRRSLNELTYLAINQNIFAIKKNFADDGD